MNVDACVRDVNVVSLGFRTKQPLSLHVTLAFSSFSSRNVFLSHIGNEDSCYGKQTMQVAIVNNSRAHPKGIFRRPSFFRETGQ